MRKTNLTDRIHGEGCDCKKCCDKVCTPCRGLWGIKSIIEFPAESLNGAVKIAATFALGVLTLFLLSKTVNEVKQYEYIGQNTNGVQNSITVTGKAETMAKPDITTFEYTVSEEGKTLAEAQNKVAAESNQALAYLKTKGIDEKDLKTLSYTTNPKYGTKTEKCQTPTKGAPLKVQPMFKAEKGNAVSTEPAVAPSSCVTSSSEIVGYEAVITVQVKVRDITKNPTLAGELVAQIGKMGARVSALTNTFEDLNKIKQTIREEAIYNARKEASILARDLGVKLGKVISFNENNYPYPYALGDARAMSSMKVAEVAPEMPVGENKVTSEVTVTYSIR